MTAGSFQCGRFAFLRGLGKALAIASRNPSPVYLYLPGHPSDPAHAELILASNLFK
jgi:hypothetical protein